MTKQKDKSDEPIIAVPSFLFDLNGDPLPNRKEQLEEAERMEQVKKNLRESLAEEFMRTFAATAK